MNREQYDAFTERLCQTLERDARILALVALGSMAQPERIDQWSDHDFWVVTRPESQDTLLTDLSWLPDAADIVLALRQAPQYYTVFYRSGHISEFAVFTPQQLTQGKTNAYRILFDRKHITEQVQAIYERTGREPQGAEHDALLCGNFLVHIWMGVQRSRRGEVLSAYGYLTHAALNDLLLLLMRHVPTPQPALRDSFDPRRRFEQLYPAIGAAFHRILHHDLATIAVGLLDIADLHLAAHMATYPHDAVKTVRHMIESRE
jgi:hypothetical protein